MTRKLTTVKKARTTATNESAERETCSVPTARQEVKVRTFMKKSEGKSVILFLSNSYTISLLNDEV